MTDKTTGMLGLMRRAQAIEPGEDRAGSAVKAGKAKLLLLAADASDNAAKRADGYTMGRNVPIVPLPYSKIELGAALGMGTCAMAAVTDIGFAEALMKDLALKDPERYQELAQQTAQRNDKAKRRKQEAAAHKRNKRSGKRRTKA